jgi:hypothetical protein
MWLQQEGKYHHQKYMQVDEIHIMAALSPRLAPEMWGMETWVHVLRERLRYTNATTHYVTRIQATIVYTVECLRYRDNHVSDIFSSALVIRCGLLTSSQAVT